MRPVLSRLFLLLLLACDFAADPSMVAPALEPSSAPMAFTTCFCHSVVYRETLRQVLTSEPEHAVDCPILACRQPEPFAVAWQEPPHTFHSSDLPYVFQSIRC